MKTYDDGESVRPKTGKKPRDRRPARKADRQARQDERLADAETLRDF